MGSVLNTMPYEFRKNVKSVATVVNAVQDEEIVKVIAEEVSLEDPVNAKEIIEEIVNGTEEVGVHQEDIKKPRGKVRV